MILIKKLLTAALCSTLLAFSAVVARASANSRQAEQAGADLFRDKGCAYCHGAQTQGTAKGPNLQKVRKTMKAPAITGQILNGGRKMPPFSDSLTNDEVSQLVAWLRAKHRPEPTPKPPAPPASNP